MGITTRLAREDPITLQTVQSGVQEHGVSRWTGKQAVKAVLRIATDCRKRGQFGRAGAALLVGTTMFGTSFVTTAERTGILLCNAAGSERFRQFLAHFAIEAGAAVSEDWRFLTPLRVL
jgi:hypothetical protein